MRKFLMFLPVYTFIVKQKLIWITNIPQHYIIYHIRILFSPVFFTKYGKNQICISSFCPKKNLRFPSIQIPSAHPWNTSHPVDQCNQSATSGESPRPRCFDDSDAVASVAYELYTTRSCTTNSHPVISEIPKRSRETVVIGMERSIVSIGSESITQLPASTRSNTWG